MRVVKTLKKNKINNKVVIMLGVFWHKIKSAFNLIVSFQIHSGYSTKLTKLHL